MKTFKELLREERQRAQLSGKQLAELANVPESLISGLQTGTRRIGEKQAARIANALSLSEPKFSRFIFTAMNESEERLLSCASRYPVEALNFVPLFMNESGVLSSQITQCNIEKNTLEIGLETGEKLTIIANIEFDYRFQL
jgi:transcriptional regulator with XRE-family HTH domain